VPKHPHTHKASPTGNAGILTVLLIADGEADVQPSLFLGILAQYTLLVKGKMRENQNSFPAGRYRGKKLSLTDVGDSFF